jgi:hypothetical protein
MTTVRWPLSHLRRAMAREERAVPPVPTQLSRLWQLTLVLVPVLATIYIENRITKVQHELSSQLAERQAELTRDLGVSQELYRRRVLAYDDLYAKATTINATMQEYMMDRGTYTRAADEIRALWDSATLHRIYLSPAVLDAVGDVHSADISVLESRNPRELKKLEETTRRLADAIAAELQIKPLPAAATAAPRTAEAR